MVFDKVKEIITKELNVDAAKITMEAQMSDDLGFDSLDAVEVLMSIEDELDITIEDEVAQNFKTIGDLVNYIETLMK